MNNQTAKTSVNDRSNGFGFMPPRFRYARAKAPRVIANEKSNNTAPRHRAARQSSNQMVSKVVNIPSNSLIYQSSISPSPQISVKSPAHFSLTGKWNNNYNHMANMVAFNNNVIEKSTFPERIDTNRSSSSFSYSYSTSPREPGHSSIESNWNEINDYSTSPQSPQSLFYLNTIINAYRDGQCSQNPPSPENKSAEMDEDDLNQSMSASMDYYMNDTNCTSTHPHLLLQQQQESKEDNAKGVPTNCNYSDGGINNNGNNGNNGQIMNHGRYPFFDDVIHSSPYGQKSITMIQSSRSPSKPCININNVTMNITPAPSIMQYNGYVTIRQVLQQKLSLMQLIEVNLIKPLIFDQDGSRYIQSLLNNGNSDNVSLLIQHLLSSHKYKRLDLSSLACHEYGNYALSLIFKLCNNSELKLLLIAFLYESIITISESFYGHRVVIKIMDILYVKKKDLLFKLLKQFKKRISQICPEYDFGHYVKNKMNEYCSLIIQKMLELNLPHHTIKFIGDALESNLCEFCGTIYGSRIVQKYISFYAQKLNVLKLFDDKDSYFSLSKSKYGNYTIQAILNNNTSYSNAMIYKKFRNKFICNIFMDGPKLTELSINKHGSQLIETCIKISTKQQINIFIETICNDKAHILSQILHGEYGNFVARCLLRSCVDLSYESQAHYLVSCVNKHVINLSNCAKYGQSYVDGMNLQRCTSFIKHCCHLYL